MEFSTLVTEDRRLALLQLLTKSSGMSSNTLVLASGLRSIGHACSCDQVEGDVAWLAEMGLVAVEDLGQLRVVQLTRRGDDVAAGRAVVPGVKRPVPGV